MYKIYILLFLKELMKVVEHLERARDPLVSFEVIPPKRGGSLDKLVAIVTELRRFSPSFIDVTSHSSVVVADKKKRKSPGSFGLCSLIQNQFKIDAVLHTLCNGFTREETEDLLIDADFAGIRNVLAIGGDGEPIVEPPHGRTVNHYALDLVKQIVCMNNGNYLDDVKADKPTDFCIGVAAYPERYFGSKTEEQDLNCLKEKVKAGAGYAVTQMFFNNTHYFRLIERCRAAGLEIPIIPGIKIITNKGQVSAIPDKIKGVTFSREFMNDVHGARDNQVMEIGITHAYNQVRELLDRRVPAVHFYVSGSPDPTAEVLKRLGL